MKVGSTKSIRFTALVEAAGQPEVANLWTQPDQDKRFMKAVRENRVLTVKQENVGAGKDFGVVGCLREKNASYLVFSKSLNQFKDRRVVGIKYDLVRTPAPVGKVVKQRHNERRGWGRGVLPQEWTSPAATVAEAKTAVLKKEKPAKKFRVVLRFVASVDVTTQVEGKNNQQARQEAFKAAGTPDFSKGIITRKIVKVAEVR